MFPSTLLVAVSLLSSFAAAVPAEHLDARSVATCSKDALYNTIACAEFSSSARVFCSTYIKQTVTRTATKIVTLAGSSTVTPKPVTSTTTATITSTSVITTTSSFLETTSNTLYKRVPTFTIASSSPSSSSSAKSSSSSSSSAKSSSSSSTKKSSSSSTTSTKASGIGYPKFISSTYPASRVSSACSCLITPSLLKTTTISKTITQTTLLKGTVTLSPSIARATTTTSTVITTTSVVAAPTDIYCNVTGVANGATLIQDSWRLYNDSSSCMQWCTEKSCSLIHFGCPDDCYCALYSSNDLSQMYEMGSGSYGSAYTFWDSRCAVPLFPAQQAGSPSP